MKKRLISIITAAAATVTLLPSAAILSSAETNAPARQMEYLDRGLVAVKTSSGVYLSWRLLGTESLSNQAFDIYRNGQKINTTGAHDATCYTDTSGSVSSSYIVVPAGESIDGEKAVTPWDTNVAYSSNSVAYKDILFDVPADGTTPDDNTYTYGTATYTADKDNIKSRVGINDMSVGDLDGDGEYELIVKWDPSNSQDNSNYGYTGNVYLDGYEISSNNTSYMWRIDLGINIRAGAHYTQFLVYDFDCDGKSEIVCKTAPGSKDGKGNYVSAVGVTEEIRNTDNSQDYRNSGGYVLDGPEFLTIFNGETGEAMQTVDYDPPRSIKALSSKASGWGDDYGNRCDRFLAGVAYLDGVHPSLIMTRGYYTYSYAAAYTWDGENLTQQWLSSNEPVGTGSASGCTVKYADGTTNQQKDKTLYGQGAHSLSVADVDNDNCDEIIFGSAILDHDGTVLLYDGRGHGDAEHVSDFDNDGQQEIFMVHEEGKGNYEKDSDGNYVLDDNGEKILVTIPYAVDIKRHNGDVMTQAAAGDIGRGVMANIDDDYALSSGNLAAFWSVADKTNLYNQKGEVIGKYPDSNGNHFENSLVYWDGDLGREMLDGTMIAKQDIDSGSTTRIYYNRQNSSFPNVLSNNTTKQNPSLSADILGDWREEIIYPLADGTGARIYFSTIPTTYRLTTLMHDSQYRSAIAWQNVGYNQPPHTSYYIGSAALAKDGSTALNYLAPAVPFTKVTYPEGTQGTPKPTVSSAPTPTPTPAPDIITVNADADTYLVYNDSSAAHGSEPELKINQATDMYSSSVPGLKEAAGLGLIRFNLSEYKDKELISAQLQLYDKYTNNDEATSTLFLDYCSNDDWDEASLTADGITIRGAGTPFSSLGLSQTPEYSKNYSQISFDVTDAIKADTDNTHTFALWTFTAREQIIASKEYTGSDAKAPVLVLTFAAPEPEETPSPSPAVTQTPSESTAPDTTDKPIETTVPTASTEPSPDVTQTPAYAPVIYDAYTRSAMFNSAQTAENAAVIFACYGEGGILKSVSVKNAAIRDEEINTVKANDSFNDDGDVKIYVWESVESMKPLDVNGTGITVPTPEPEPVKIMPLGDSITNGFSVAGAYRNELCSLLEKDGLSDMVDFVGSQKTGTGYDNDNEGHSGWAIAAISAADDCEKKGRQGLTTNIDSWMNTYSPDIVLLQIGTNDILSLYKLDEAPARLETLVDKVLAKLPANGKLYLATIPYISETANYNKTGKTQTELDEIVNTYNASVKALAEKKSLTLVDINSSVTLSDLKDGIHPTADGYAKMGTLWYSTLENEIRSRVE